MMGRTFAAKASAIRWVAAFAQAVASGRLVRLPSLAPLPISTSTFSPFAHEPMTVRESPSPASRSCLAPLPPALASRQLPARTGGPAGKFRASTPRP